MRSAVTDTALNYFKVLHAKSAPLYQDSFDPGPCRRLCRSVGAGACAGSHLAECLLRPDARVLRRFQPRLRPLLEGADRAGTHPQTVARGLGQAGALHHRWAGGRRGHARARLGHRGAAHRGQADPRKLAAAPAAQRFSLHLDHRAGGAPGQPQGHPRLGRPDQARRQRDHAQPQDLGRGALELPGGMGIRPPQIWQRCPGRGLHPQAVCQCAGA